ncbi:hypothetical protein B0H13DRAFT_1878844 [Mycena leptocephala]|nr:hypothetical protein B0H13DRAFT_1878844 [Mycena leptocephala]
MKFGVYGVCGTRCRTRSASVDQDPFSSLRIESRSIQDGRLPRAAIFFFRCITREGVKGGKAQSRATDKWRSIVARTSRLRHTVCIWPEGVNSVKYCAVNRLLASSAASRTLSFLVRVERIHQNKLCGRDSSDETQEVRREKLKETSDTSANFRSANTATRIRTENGNIVKEHFGSVGVKATSAVGPDDPPTLGAGLNHRSEFCGQSRASSYPAQRGLRSNHVSAQLSPRTWDAPTRTKIPTYAAPSQKTIVGSTEERSRTQPLNGRRPAHI